MRFVLVIKIDPLGTTREFHLPDVSLGSLEDTFCDVSPKIQKVTVLVFQAQIWWNKLKIMQWKCICTRG